MAIGSTTPITDFSGLVPVPQTKIPRLEPGDRLTSAEFERRYDTMPEVKKAELIEGVVYMPSPVSFSQHSNPHSHLIGWLCLYEAQTPGVVSGDNSTLKIDNDNRPQPDALLLIDPASGGRATIDEQGYINGAPELVAEIASSSVSIDLNQKLNVYRRSGVREYVVWRVLDQAIDWFILRDGQYVPLPSGDDGILRSETFPGLWLGAPAMLAGQLDVALATLQQGLATPEHQQFVAQLGEQRNK